MQVQKGLKLPKGGLKDNKVRQLPELSNMSPSCKCFCFLLLLSSVASGGAATSKRDTGSMEFEIAALGRPLFPGMLYDSRTDAFIPGVTLWDKKSLNEDLDTRTQLQTELKFSSSDSLNSKCSLLDVSGSLKASFMSGLVKVGGAANYLLDTKSSNQQSRITMYYSETTRFEQLTMTQLGHITYPQVFEQKTATHVVTSVLYGARAIMVFDRTFSEDENKQKIEAELNFMVEKIPNVSIKGVGAVNMTDDEKKIAESIRCSFHGDFHLERNPTTYMEALQVFKQLPTQLGKNKQNVVPIKVSLYPLHQLNTQAARLVTKISTSLLFNTEAAIDELGDAKRICNDLLKHPLVNVFSDIEDRLHSFHSSLIIYKMALQKALGQVLPSIRGGEKDKQSLVDIMRNHRNSPFRTISQWLDNTMSELHRLSFCTKSMNGIRTEDSDGLNNILLNPDIDIVVCFALTSLKYKDNFLLSLSEFLNSEDFTKFEGTKTALFLLDEVSNSKWFNNPGVIIKMREHLILFKSFLEANKDNKKMHFIISAISDASNPGSSIYLYENAKLTDRQFQPVSKPPPPRVKSINENSVSLTLQKSPTAKTMSYKVEYKEVNSENMEEWFVTNTPDENFTLSGLKSGKQYLIRYRIVGRVGVSEASDTLSAKLNSSEQTPSVLVGGRGGDEFFISTRDNTFKKISITFDKYEPFCTIQITFNDGRTYQYGTEKGNREADFLFDQDDKISAATVWPNDKNTRFAGLEFEVTKSNGERKKYSAKGTLLGEPVSLDVKSGRFYGIKVRSGEQIDALGFLFI